MTDFSGAGAAGRANRALEPLHAMIYFAPEADEEYQRVGLKRGRMGYFASRSAAMGPVSAGVVTATFYNFHPGLVAHNIPKAWTLASTDDVLAARSGAADRALRRLRGDAVDTPEGDELASLARAATDLPGPCDWMVAHVQILPADADGRIARLVDGRDDVGRRSAGTLVEGIPLVGHCPTGSQGTPDSGRVRLHVHPGRLELRGYRMSDEPRADQIVDVPVPERHRVAGRPVKADVAAAPLHVATEGRPLPQRKDVAAHVVPNHGVEAGEIGRRHRSGLVGNGQRPAPAAGDRDELSAGRLHRRSVAEAVDLFKHKQARSSGRRR